MPIPPSNPRQRYLEIHRNALLGRLRTLASRLENPELTRNQLDLIRADVQECQKKLKELGFADPSQTQAQLKRA